MEKISGLAISATQQQLMTHMQQTAASASAGGISSASTGGDIMMNGPDSASFGQVLNRAIDNVNQLQHSAGARQTAIDRGESDDLTGAMIESQKASVAFTAMMQVRNKLTSALDEVMNTPL